MTTKILVYQFLVVNHGCYTAQALSAKVGKSLSSVRQALDSLRDEGRVERQLDIGSNGRMIYQWYS